MILNNICGRFGMRGSMLRTEIVTDPNELLKILRQPFKEVGNLMFASGNIIYVTSKERKVVASKSAPCSNVVIDSYTTAQGRLKLYKYLEQLGEQVIYMDTDSLVFTAHEQQQRPNDYTPETGSFLGALTDKLVEYGAGARIQTFVSGRPMFYAHRFVNDGGETSDVCKVKGIRLSYINKSTSI
ncbi:hypothetical protein QAD02_003441 [Eretmocerus hayati]|uniref:Uncharacterized protein n=1 Tax=Eretmocerus hayati TaxID=131215 RepID=A0ACC2NM43_9HYME|nr:hypothetical protein QAD02_003441 [Eretmocerus hayati]